MPNPAEWVTIRRIRLKDAVENVFWLSKTPFPKADNRNVLTPYTKSMRSLISTGKYNRGERPSGWKVSNVWSKDNGGAISPNILPARDELATPELLAFPNTSSNDLYRRRSRALDVRSHPATFPAQVVEFFIKLLTDESDVVMDPFAGSNTVGHEAERLGRNWISAEISSEYSAMSALRWPQLSVSNENEWNVELKEVVDANGSESVG